LVLLRDESTTKALMKSFGIVVDDILLEEMPQVAFAEDDEVVEALCPDGADEALSEGITVGAVAGDADALDAVVAEHGSPSFGEKWVSVVDEVSGLPEESVEGVEKVAGHLFHPRIVWCDADTSDMHLAGLEFHHEEDHVADCAKGAKCLDGEEVAGVQSFPMAFEELLPGSLARALGFRLNTRFFEDAGDSGSSNVMLQASKGVTDLGVAPAGIFVGKTDDELSDVLGLARPARCFPIGGAVVLLDRELSEPIEESLRGDDLAAGLALGRRERFAPYGEAPALVVGERDTLATGDLSEDFAQDSILFMKVLKAERHALIECADDEGDEELDG